MGVLAVIAMFILPAYVALNGMFGKDLDAVLRGTGPDRVKYVKTDD